MTDSSINSIGNPQTQVKVVISTTSSPPLLVVISVNAQLISMEVDNGAGASLMSLSMFLDLFPTLHLSESSVSLSSASGDLTVCGEVQVSVLHRGQTYSLPLVICDSLQVQYPLLGRPWLDILVPDWRKLLSPTTSIASIITSQIPTVSELQKMFPRVFDSNSDSPIEGFQARLVLKENAIPVKHRAYKVPFGLVDTYDHLLDSWLAEDKAVRTRQAEWASPGFPVPKKNGTYRLVVDFKKSLNPQLRVDHYPIPSPEEIFSDLSASSVFVNLDLKDAYMQLLLHPESQELCVVATHRGFYKLKRMIYGIASAAAIFQSVMEEILIDIPGVKVYLDNILIHGDSIPTVIQRTFLVLARLDKHNVRLNLSKCDWFVDQFEFLGFTVNKHGRQPAPSLLKCIDDFQPPTNVKQVRSFVGLVNFYSLFIPQFATIAKALFNLLKSDEPFLWSKDCQNAFSNCKSLLKSDKLLIHFNPSLPIVIYTDASPYGIGSALCHTVKIKNKLVDRPVMLVSSSLTPAQQNYAQIDREGLAVIHAVSKFHRFIWGRPFTLVTDCEAIQRILNPSKSLPVRTGHRLQHWAAILQAYQYSLIHKKAEHLVVADALSRLPSPITVEDVLINVIKVKVATSIPLTSQQIAAETCNDPLLQQVLKFVHLGWPPKDKFKDNPALQSYFKIRDSLTICDKCLMFSARVVIPPSLQSTVLQTLHEGHPGIVRSKLLAREFVWWPSLAEDISTMASNCSICALVNFKPDKVYIPWPKSTFPFERVHIDFYEKRSLTYFILCDSYSKWLHVSYMPNTKARTVISELMSIFAQFGLPKCLVSDNGPPFDSNEYAQFCTQYNIKILHSPPYSPESNGQAEKAVDLAKKGVDKIILSELSPNVDLSGEKPDLYTIQNRLSKFLFNYRNTPTTTTNLCPTEMLLRFKPCTLLTHLLPSSNTPLSDFHFRDGEEVLFRVNKNSPIIKGTIEKSLGPNRYLISVCGVKKIVYHNQLTRA